MNSRLDHLFTPESLAVERQRRQLAVGPAEEMLAHYREDRAALLTSYPAIGQWNTALEDRDLEAATAPQLWRRMLDDGLAELPRFGEHHPTNTVYAFRVVSPKVLDAFRDDPSVPRTDFAFTTLRVCLRKASVDCPEVQVPASWSEVSLIDTELFEIPPGVAPDTFDDCEKIHVVYLAGIQDGRLEYRPVFIGIGTGEAYGVGPRVRTSPGRFRFYRYDVKDNFHLEYVRAAVGPQTDSWDVQDIPFATEIRADRATLVLGRGAADRGMMCLSDPVLERIHRQWLLQNPHNHLVYQSIGLARVRHDLRSESPSVAFVSNDVAAVLRYAFDNHRWFFVAWQHPERLSEVEGVLRYYTAL